MEEERAKSAKMDSAATSMPPPKLMEEARANVKMHFAATSMPPSNLMEEARAITVKMDSAAKSMPPPKLMEEVRDNVKMDFAATSMPPSNLMEKARAITVKMDSAATSMPQSKLMAEARAITVNMDSAATSMPPSNLMEKARVTTVKMDSAATSMPPTKLMAEARAITVNMDSATTSMPPSKLMNEARDKVKVDSAPTSMPPSKLMEEARDKVKMDSAATSMPPSKLMEEVRANAVKMSSANTSIPPSKLMKEARAKTVKMDSAAKSMPPPKLMEEARAKSANVCPRSPKLLAIMANIEYEYCNYKYTVYRCAGKFVALQKVFQTAPLSYKLVLAVLERYRWREASASLMVPPFQFTSFIRDIYFAGEKWGQFAEIVNYHLESVTSVLSNFFWDIFDPHRRHSISLLEIKITLLLMCKLSSSEILPILLFHLLKDEKTECVSKFNLENLMTILIKITAYIGEEKAYGAHNMPVVLEQAYAKCQNSFGLTEGQFVKLWNSKQTRFTIYSNLINLIKRIEDTEQLVHSNECASCKIEKIVGLRFKCKTCDNFSLCMKCFGNGFSSSRHEKRHRLYEAFDEDVPPRKLSYYLAKFCNIFCTPKSNEETKNFCNEETDTHIEPDIISMDSSALSNFAEEDKIEKTLAGLAATAMNASNTSERLQSIIDRLLEQNKKLEKQLKCVNTASNEEISVFLSVHHQFLIEIIAEMRNFTESHKLSFPTSSTPNQSLLGKQSLLISHELSKNESRLTNSIMGADINRSYLDANKSDSLTDLSLWLNQRRRSMSTRTTAAQQLEVVEEVVKNGGETDSSVSENVDRNKEIKNFKILVHKVKDIVEDSYSENTKLAEATQDLEYVLDNIIKTEEDACRGND